MVPDSVRCSTLYQNMETVSTKYKYTILLFQVRIVRSSDTKLYNPPTRAVTHPVMVIFAFIFTPQVPKGFTDQRDHDLEHRLIVAVVACRHVYPLKFQKGFTDQIDQYLQQQ